MGKHDQFKGNGLLVMSVHEHQLPFSFFSLLQSVCKNLCTYLCSNFDHHVVVVLPCKLLQNECILWHAQSSHTLER